MFKNLKTLKHKLIVIFALICAFTSTPHYFTEGCSSRAVPKPRPSTSSSTIISTTSTTTAAPTTTTLRPTTARPNISFPTYKCPATYDAWYCLNDATCFSVKIGQSIMYNCECAIGFMGPRCEYKELDGSYLPKRPRPLLEKASIASGATCALLFMLFICLTLYLRYDQKTKVFEYEYEDDTCQLCKESRCCDAANADLDTNMYYSSLLPDTEKYHNSNLRQYIATLPISFAIKRSTKL
ncbi:protein spitz [Teleopsis dalmanni]|uniref:protein spitz n=1 Tax=Teleopsis dalmanni TaxID=139649 RepID=UPI0018CFCF98|nr:protein spitz [Teleopsis dalmanni]